MGPGATLPSQDASAGFSLDVGSTAGDWEAWGSDDGLHSVHVLALSATVEEAARMAIFRARAKYGRAANLTAWRFSVKPQHAGGPVLHFRAGPDDRAIQLDPP